MNHWFGCSIRRVAGAVLVEAVLILAWGKSASCGRGIWVSLELLPGGVSAVGVGAGTRLVWIFDMSYLWLVWRRKFPLCQPSQGLHCAVP